MCAESGRSSVAQHVKSSFAMTNRFAIASTLGRFCVIASLGVSWAACSGASKDPTHDAQMPPDAYIDPAIGQLCGLNTGPIQLPGNLCTGDVARDTFRFGLCSCGDLDGSASSWNVDAINSATQTSMLAGAVGASGKFVGGAGNIYGSVWAAGIGSSEPVVQTGTMTFNSDVHSGGDLTTNGVGSLKRDAYVAGAVDGSGGVLYIDGTLHQPSSSPAPVGVTPGGGIITEPVTVPEVCNCSQPIPISTIVNSFKNTNDNAALGLTPSSLAGVDNRQLALGCGRFYFDAITANTLVITVIGRTAIFVAGDIDAQMSINVQSGGSLDLFVAGNVHLHGAWSLGSSQAPANTRFYVAGQSVTLDGAFAIDGNVYAPNVDLAITNSAFSVRGALYARSIRINGIAAQVTYDQAIADVDGCRDTGGSCTSCHDCDGATPACKNGTCGTCTSDADCCAPLLCQPDGTCKADVIL
jgi:hypothetical protein